MRSLILQTIATLVGGALLLGLLLFLLAGTLDYWQAWVFIVVFVVLMSAHGAYLSIKDPELLERRKQVAPKEETTAQRVFIFAGFALDIALLVFSAFDHRFGWSQVPPYVSLGGDVLVALSFLIWHLVFKENSFTASSIRTFEGQRVISTGPYALVRHPKYVGDLVLITGIPLALGSWWGLAFVALAILALAWRILDEEKLLAKDLPGYAEYEQHVRYRLVPHLW